MLEPNAIVLYVDNLEISTQFYQELLGTKPKEASPTFNAFTLSNGMSLGLKAKHSVIPAFHTNSTNCGGELAFTVDSHKLVDHVFANWRDKGIQIIQEPTAITFGYTFLALDPDGNRLRVVSLGTSSH